ncbi:MAG: hypothetical protein LIO62_03205 [Clostridiales bacterium]|nr:hypothetical protein [Clostridiales bacterium]
MDKNENKNKNKKENKKEIKKKNIADKDKQKFVDLTSYISPDIVKADVNGSYTGVPKEAYYGENLYEEPVQDADDL